MSDQAAVKVTVYGRVQGVFFRAFTEERATTLGLSGYVRNLPAEGAVEVLAEGPKKSLETLVSYLRRGPPAARVSRVVTEWSAYTGRYSGFSIRY